MQQLPSSQYRMQFGIKGWAAIAIGLTAFIAVATLLAIGFLFVALPMIVLAPLIYWFMPKRISVSGQPTNMEARGNSQIIDGTFHEVDPKP
jgi:hypothetical protein